ncbi:MAG TPA: aldo/keto reductase [Candidatus Baltobacteraceae bacterium]|nr:aldo/keto reductase [Candidatus Baltobacteraceae bacterium]
MSTSRTITPSAAAGGSFTLGGDLKVHRLGFGAMRLTGQGIWGEPRDRKECINVLKTALDLGVTLIDTADSYGPDVSENIIAEALYPYPENLVIATKAGLLRPGPGRWEPDCRPQHLREAVEGSLKRLRVDRIDLLQLHTVDPKLPYAEQVGTLVELQREGKIRQIGVSNVDIDELKQARELATVVSVQNMYNLTDRESEDVLNYCTAEKIGFIPWFPLATGNLAEAGGPLDEIAHRVRATPAQVALAWLLAKSPVMLPIPGTSSVKHLKENIGAAVVKLSADDIEALEA